MWKCKTFSPDNQIARILKALWWGAGIIWPYNIVMVSHPVQTNVTFERVHSWWHNKNRHCILHSLLMTRRKENVAFLKCPSIFAITFCMIKKEKKEGIILCFIIPFTGKSLCPNVTMFRTTNCNKQYLLTYSVYSFLLYLYVLFMLDSASLSEEVFIQQHRRFQKRHYWRDWKKTA